jgi:hypothetical protein
MMPPSIWSKKPHQSTFKMTIADAAVRHPNATPILSTREVRNPLSAITADSAYQRGSRVLTPQDKAYHDWIVSRIGWKDGGD